MIRISQGIDWYKVLVVGKHGKLNETIEVSALWSNMVSSTSGQNRWILCPLVPEAIIKFSVMPAGLKLRFSHELLHLFHDLKKKGSEK